MNTTITTLSDAEIYTQAADALTASNLDIYEAIKAAAPGLDWTGHDRRAALARGATLQTLGADPALQHLTAYVPRTIDLKAHHIKPCAGCGALIYWSLHHQKAHPFDVDGEGRGTSTSHFQTCPNAEDFRPKKKAATTTAAKRRSRKVA